MNPLYYIAIFIVLIVCSVFYANIAKKLRILDIPNERSSHMKPIIRGGGILFFIAMLSSFILNDFQFLYAFIAIAILAIISFVDDIATLSAKARLPFHLIAMSLICYQLGILEISVLFFMIAVIFAIAFINMFNFMDGINAISGLNGIVIVAAFSVLSLLEELSMEIYFIPLLFALLIFGFSNFRKHARIFAGDVGSISLAAFIAFFLGFFTLKFEAPILLLLGVVFLVDATNTIILRILRKENIAKAHRNHLYQKLVDVAGWSHLKVSSVYGSIQAGVCILSLLFYKEEMHTQLSYVFFIVLGLSTLYFVGISRLNKLQKM